MKKILITGTGGVLGSSLAIRLLGKKRHIYAFTSNIDRLRARIPYWQNISFYDNFADIPFQDVDLIVHCAFSRSQNCMALAQSIDFSEQVFKSAITHHVPKVINVSSQSIYGGYREKPSKEEGIIDPLDNYAWAKYASEKIGTAISSGSSTQITHVRLASLIGSAFPERVINKMMKNAMEKSTIQIVGGTQVFSFLDLRDAVSGLFSMISRTDEQWEHIYNLGTTEEYTICEIAEKIKECIETEKGSHVEINLNKKEIRQQIRLDTRRFTADFGWTAQYSLLDSIKAIYEDLYGSTHA